MLELTDAELLFVIGGNKTAGGVEAETAEQEADRAYKEGSGACDAPGSPAFRVNCV